MLLKLIDKNQQKNQLDNIESLIYYEMNLI
jgi:hypothetical protein